MTELWGHVQRAEAGKERKPGTESPVQVRYQSHWQIRVAMGRHDADRIKVGKSYVSHASRKAAIDHTEHVP